MMVIFYFSLISCFHPVAIHELYRFMHKNLSFCPRFGRSHPLCVATSNVTHESLRTAPGRVSLLKCVSHFMLLSYHWTCPHATFVLKASDSESKWATESVMWAVIPFKPRWRLYCLVEHFQSQTSFEKKEVKKILIKLLNNPRIPVCFGLVAAVYGIEKKNRNHKNVFLEEKGKKKMLKKSQSFQDHVVMVMFKEG